MHMYISAYVCRYKHTHVQCVVVCCSALQCAAVCCIVLAPSIRALTLSLCMIESCHTKEWVVMAMSTCGVACMDQLPRQCNQTHWSGRYMIYSCIMSHEKCVVLHMWRRRVVQMDGACGTCEWVTSHVWISRGIPYSFRNGLLSVRVKERESVCACVRKCECRSTILMVGTHTCCR